MTRWCTAITSGPALILDTWAFLEEFLDGPRRSQLDEVRRAAGRLVTVRDVLVECHSYMLRRGRPSVAREWWTAVQEIPIRILEPTLLELNETIATIPTTSTLSAVDAAVVWAARRVRTDRIATGDRAFADVGLQPLFA